MPGNMNVVSPTVIASEATTKNQPPDIDIIVFQIRPGAATAPPAARTAARATNGSGAPDLVQFLRHGAQRLVEAERHVPGLAGEDGEDRRAFSAKHAAGKEAQKKTTVKVRKPSTGTDWRMSSEARAPLGLAAFGRQRCN